VWLTRCSCRPLPLFRRPAYADDSLELWAIAAGGCLSPKGVADSEASGDPIIWTKFPDQVARGQIARTTLIERTGFQLGEWQMSPGTFPHAAIVWVCDRRPFRDCVLFWNYRALRSINIEFLPMILVPEHDLVNWLQFDAQVLSLFQNRPNDFSPDAFFCSSRVSHERLREIANSWEMVEASEDPHSGKTYPPPPFRTPPYSYRVDLNPFPAVASKHRYGQRTQVPVQVFREETRVGFESPVSFRGFARFKVGLSSTALTPYPKRPSVARIIERNSIWHHDGIELLAQVWGQYQYTIALPTLAEVCSEILQGTLSAWALSDKGRIGESIAGHSNVEAFLEPGVFEGLRSLTTRRAKHLFNELKELAQSADDVELANIVSDIGERIERRNLCANQIEGVPKAKKAAVLENLVKLGWAERGLRIACSGCGLTSFIALGEVTPDATCPGCRRSQRYLANSAGLTTYYRLNSLIDRATDQGVIPHLMTVGLSKN
jgi:hypothetical protein